MLFYILLVAVLVALDQVLKALSRAYLDPFTFIDLIPNFIQLTHQENQGISFSLLSDLPSIVRTPLLAGISGIVICGLLIYIHRSWLSMGAGEKWGFALIISGAVGNMIDRIVRQQVTDFMHFHFYSTSFFVNNLADDLISIGFVLMLWQSVFKKNES